MDITSPELLGFSSRRLARIKTVMQRYVDENKLAGIITLVARHGKVAHMEKVGFANIGSAKPLDFDALFRIYSMTKPITSTAMMMLLEEGRFRLSDPLYAYLPAFKDMQVLTNAAGDTVPAKRLITVRDLFIHTAGLGYGLGPSNLLPEQMYQQNYWMPILSNPALTLRELFDGVAKLPLVSQPGAAWIYSVGIDVIGLLVQVISGMPFPAYLKRNLFEPLGMIDTDFHAPPDKLDRLATAYGPKNLKWPMSQATAADLAVGIGPVDVIRTNGSFTEPTGVPSGGGGLISSTHDYYRFAQMLLNRGELDGVRLLGRKTVEMMFANHLPDGVYIADDHANGFGLGGSVLLDVAKSQILGSVGTWSWGGAANTEFWIDPREDLIGLIMMQYMPTDVLPVNADFRNLAYQALVD